MPSSDIPLLIRSKPGIRRDVTAIEPQFYTDGRWARFGPDGDPRKIGGWRRLSAGLSPNIRGMLPHSKDGSTWVHAGSANKIEVLTVQNSSGAASVISDRTPGGFSTSADNIWRMEAMFDGGGGVDRIIAHAAPNLTNPDNETERPVYFGTMHATTALTAITGADNSGGIVVLYPYLFAFGNDGLVQWSVPNVPDDFTGVGSGQANITDNKVLEGRILRGGAGNNPAGLFWSQDSLIRCSFVGGAAIFDFDTLSQEISVMSSRGVVEYMGVYYWAGLDMFYMFNGVVRELPNVFNADFFFDNIAQSNRQKVFAYVNKRWGEIWWCFPNGPSATECNWAVIYNTRLQIWYDTPLPNASRTDGYYAPVFGFPLLVGEDPVIGSGNGCLMQHEYGVNEVSGLNTNAIQSYIVTHDMSVANPSVGDKPLDTTLCCEIVEPDFAQVGDISVSVTGRANPRSNTVTTTPVTFGDTVGQEDQIIKMKTSNFRLMRFKFESNVANGNYKLGRNLGHFAPGGSKLL